MVKRIKYIIGALLIFFVVLLVIFYNDIGVRKEDIESDARKFQGISDGWNSQIEVGEKVAAIIFYPDDYTEAIYSVYLNRSGTSLGFFFRGGGKINSVENGICKFYIDEYNEVAYISLNRVGVCKIVIDDGESVSSIDIDSQNPFAIVLPSNAGNVYFYNEQNEILEYIDYKL